MPPHALRKKKDLRKERAEEWKSVKKQLLDNIALVFNVFKRAEGHKTKTVKVNLKQIVKMSKDVRGGKSKLKKSISHQIIHT